MGSTNYCDRCGRKPLSLDDMHLLQCTSMAEKKEKSNTIMTTELCANCKVSLRDWIIDGQKLHQ